MSEWIGEDYQWEDTLYKANGEVIYPDTKYNINKRMGVNGSAEGWKKLMNPYLESYPELAVCALASLSSPIFSLVTGRTRASFNAITGSSFSTVISEVCDSVKTCGPWGGVFVSELERPLSPADGDAYLNSIGVHVYPVPVITEEIKKGLHLNRGHIVDLFLRRLTHPEVRACLIKCYEDFMADPRLYALDMDGASWKDIAVSIVLTHAVLATNNDFPMSMDVMRGLADYILSMKLAWNMPTVKG